MVAHFDFIRVKRFFIFSAVFFTSILFFTIPAAADTSISFGQLISASINSPVEIDKYTFDAVEGDVVLVRMTTVSPSPVDPQIRLYAPDGSLLNSSWNHGPAATEIASAPLLASGTYTVLAQDAYSNETGDYEIYIQRLSNPETETPIGFGEILSGTIDFAGKPDTYTFDALEGDLVLVKMTTVGPSPVDPQIRLYAPDGSLLNSSWNHGPAATEITSAPLPTIGTYTVLAWDAYSNEIGDYEIYIQRLSNPEIATPIIFGEILSGTIDFAGKPDTYMFDALEGDRILVKMTTIGPNPIDPQIRLYAPDGSQLNSSWNHGPAATEIASAPLPSSGTYIVLAWDAYSNEIGDYEIYIQRLSNPETVTPIGFGELISGTIDFAGKPDTYTFDALEGDVVLVKMTTVGPSPVDPQIRLYAPDGSQLNSSWNHGPAATEITSAPLPSSGTYTVLTWDAYSNETGNYAIQLILIVGSEGSLTVRPVEALNSSGIEGGPFTPSVITYTLKNVGDQAIDWTLTKTQDWLDISKAGGTLAADSTDSITVSINAQAASLSADAYFNTLTFTNLTEPDQVILRRATLLVKTPEGLLVVTPDSSFAAAGPRHGPFVPSNMTYTLKNAGDALLNWKVAKAGYWLAVSTEQGSLNSGDTVEVQVAINDAPDDFAWGVYKDRISFINTTTGNGDTLRDVNLNIEAIPSEITCRLSKSSIILGEPLEVTGQITPKPIRSGAFVDVALVAADGTEVHRSVVANALGKFSYAVACEDINQEGVWSVYTSWSGDEGLFDATSDEQSLEVAKAQTRLTIDAGSGAIKIGDPVDISGKLTPNPNCGADLSGRNIKLVITGPGGISQSQTVVTNSPFGHFVLSQYTGFNALGDWSVQASFATDDAYDESSAELVTLKVVETAGYAVIVEGRISSEEGLASHNKTVNFVYAQLKLRGLQDDDIYYLNYDNSQPGVDDIPSKVALKKAVTQWARDKMTAKPANLYIIMVDHGLVDKFYIYPDEITAINLDDWLNELQAGLSGQGSEQEILVLLGFCRAGSFVDELSAENRVIIASAAENESSYKGPLDPNDPAGVRDGEFFISEFFRAVSVGKDVLTSFHEAAQKTRFFTSTGTGSPNGPFPDDAVQHPLLDDNDDGFGAHHPSGDPDRDGYLSRKLFIGVSSITANDPGDVQVTSVSDPQFLGVADAAAGFWARVDDNNRLRSIWLEVKPPGFDHGTGGTEQIAMELPRHSYNSYNTSLERYEWDPAAGFTDAGTYKVFFFARDDLSGNVSSLVETTVYKASQGNAPPNTFSLISPQDEATELTTVILSWDDTSDPENDHITYTVLISKDDAGFSNPIRKSGLIYSACLVGTQDGLEDLSTYYWKVLAIDEYGAVTESDVRIFYTNNTNPVFGWINGRVYNASTGTPILNAQVTVGTTVLNTVAGGYYLSTLMPGSYALTVTANGYATVGYPKVDLPEGKIITRDVGLTPGSTPPGEIAAFVSRFYRLCLGRDPDEAGLNGWVSALLDGSLTGSDVARGFVLSNEFINKNTTDEEFLQVLYEAFFNRQPDPAGWQGWLDVMQNGAGREDVLNGFIYATEFAELCEDFGIKAFEGHITKDQRAAVETFVTRFYQLCLDRDPDAAGLYGWADNLLNQIQTGADVAEGFIYSPEFIAQNTTDSEYLLILYQAFFGRDADPAGLQGWLDAIAAGTPREEVLDGFIYSTEFGQLCEKYGITPFR